MKAFTSTLAIFLFLIAIPQARAKDKGITTDPNIVSGACSQLLGSWALVDQSAENKAEDSIKIELSDRESSGKPKEQWIVARYGFGTTLEVSMDGETVASSDWDRLVGVPIRVREVSRARVTSTGRVIMEERGGARLLGILPLGGTHRRLEFDPERVDGRPIGSIRVDRFDLSAHENAWQIWNPTTWFLRNARDDRGQYERQPQ